MMKFQAWFCKSRFMAKKTSKNTPAGIQLGSTVKDAITGFTGIAVARTEFGYGCVHITVQAPGVTKSGDPIPLQTFDDQRIDVLAAPAKPWPKPEQSTIKLGDTVCDTLTGLTGVATSRTVNLDGQEKIILEQAGLTADGEPKPPFCATGRRLEVVDRRQLKVSKSSIATSGGPMARLAVHVE